MWILNRTYLPFPLFSYEFLFQLSSFNCKKEKKVRKTEPSDLVAGNSHLWGDLSTRKHEYDFSFVGACGHDRILGKRHSFRLGVTNPSSPSSSILLSAAILFFDPIPESPKSNLDFGNGRERGDFFWEKGSGGSFRRDDEIMTRVWF